MAGILKERGHCWKRSHCPVQHVLQCGVRLTFTEGKFTSSSLFVNGTGDDAALREPARPSALPPEEADTAGRLLPGKTFLEEKHAQTLYKERWNAGGAEE